MRKKIFIALGGTGGHIFPAIAFAEELKEKDPEVIIEFIGGKLATNLYFDQKKYSYYDIFCGKLKTNPFACLYEFGKIGAGTVQALSAIRKFKPDLIVGFGSYHSFPVLLAAKLAKIPIILHESNSIPGRVVKLFSPYSLATAIYFPNAKGLLKGNTIPVKMPIRGKCSEDVHCQEARNYYHFNENSFTLLAFGGSQGAKVINKTFYQAICQYLKKAFPDLQVIHFVGKDEDCNTISHNYLASGVKAVVKPFEQKMEMAWKSADLVVSRAGASSIAEQIEYAVPGVLIPYELAQDDHQNANAAFIASKEMSLVLRESELNAEALAVAILKARSNLLFMKQKIKDYNHILKAPKLRDVTLSCLSQI